MTEISAICPSNSPVHVLTQGGVLLIMHDSLSYIHFWSGDIGRKSEAEEKALGNVKNNLYVIKPTLHIPDDKSKLRP